jgi:hypothetical protein
MTRTHAIASLDLSTTTIRTDSPAHSSIFHLYLNTKGKLHLLYRKVAVKSNGIRNRITVIHPNYLYFRG